MRLENYEDDLWLHPNPLNNNRSHCSPMTAVRVCHLCVSVFAARAVLPLKDNVILLPRRWHIEVSISRAKSAVSPVTHMTKEKGKA